MHKRREEVKAACAQAQQKTAALAELTPDELLADDGTVGREIVHVLTDDGTVLRVDITGAPGAEIVARLRRACAAED